MLSTDRSDRHHHGGAADGWFPDENAAPCEERMTTMTKTDKKPGGRQPIPIDPKQIEALASLWLTKEAVADFLGISRTTLFDRIRTDPDIEAAWRRGRSKTQAQTMQGLIGAAKNGNIRALMFLSERICGLKETIVHEGQVETRYVVELPTEVLAQDWQQTFSANNGHTVN
jgi:hypothetical protein